MKEREAQMATYDEAIRVVTGPGRSRVSLSLASAALLATRADARRRLESAISPKDIEPAIAETRAVAARVASSISGMPADAATLSALFLLANEDLMPHLPADVRRELDEYREKHGEDAVNELSAVCQLEDLPRFFATAQQESLQSYFDRHLSPEGDLNVLANECLLYLDER